MKKVTVLSLIILLFISSILSSFGLAKTEAEIEVYQYIAFGDSITAGYEPHIVAEDQVYGFVERVFEQSLYYGRAEATNYGILGLTSTGFLNLIQAISNEQQVTADDIQPNLIDPRANDMLNEISTIRAKVEQADLITITIGGNDFIHLHNEMQGMTDAQFEALLQERFTVLASNLEKSITLLFEINPDVTLVVADQYQPFPSLFQNYSRLEQAKNLFTSNIDELVKKYNSQGLDIRAAKVAKAFAGKSLTLTHILRADIHPTQLGYQTIAQVFAEAIWGTYHPAVRKEPIRIIVGGEELSIPYLPLLIKDTTFIPVREYAEALGAEVKWDNQLKSAVVEYQGRVVRYNIGSDIIFIGDKEVKVSSNVELINGKTYVPLRAISEGIGFDVEYIHQSRTAYINP